VVENERFGGKRIEKGGWTTKYKDRHLESQGDGEHPFLLPKWVAQKVRARIRSDS